jgi:hypothetical protein
MSKNNNTNNNIPAQPVYIMQPQQPQQNDSSIFDGLGNIALKLVLLAYFVISGAMSLNRSWLHWSLSETDLTI